MAPHDEAVQVAGARVRGVCEERPCKQGESEQVRLSQPLTLVS